MELFNIINLIANIIILSMLILIFSKSENLFLNNTHKNDLNKIDDSKDYDKYDINLKYYLEEIYKQIDGIQTVVMNKAVQLSLF